MKPIFQVQVALVALGLFACAGANFNSGGQQQQAPEARKAQNSADQQNAGTSPDDNNTDQSNSGKHSTTDQKNSGGNKDGVDQSGGKGGKLGSNSDGTPTKSPVDSASNTAPAASTDGATLKAMLNTPKLETDNSAATLAALTAGGNLLGTVLSNLPPGNPNGGPNGGDPNEAGEPLIIDMSGNGIALSAPADGPLFDIFGNGNQYRISWPVNPTTSVWLVHVVKGQSFAQNVSTLFGTKTLGPDGKIAPDGFTALAKYDLPLYGGHGNGILDKNTPIWSELFAWQNVKRDGVINLTDLRTLDDIGIHKIAVRNLATGKCDKDQYNNWTGSRSVVCIGNCDLDPDKWVTRNYFDLWFTIPGLTNTPPPCSNLVDAFKLKQ